MRQLGKLSYDIEAVVAAYNQRGQGPTAKQIADELYGDDYIRLRAVHRCLRNLEEKGFVIRVVLDVRTGAEWWRPAAYSASLQVMQERLRP